MNKRLSTKTTVRPKIGGKKLPLEAYSAIKIGDKKDIKKNKIGYVCSTAFDVEPGLTDIEVYSTEEALRASCSCVDKNEKYHGGIYKVKITLEEVIQPEPEWKS